MAAYFTRNPFATPKGRRLVLLLVALPVASVVGASWWLTAPLEPSPVADAIPATAKSKAESADEASAPPKEAVMPEWPAGRLDGMPAKELLLTTLERVQERFAKVEGYTATFHKQERLRGKLGPEQTLAMKVRERPFAVYFKFLAPNPGKEVVYAEGQRDNKVIAHSTGVSRLLVPRLMVPPDHPLALADSRHPVTEAGLSHLIDRLVGFRHKDIKDASATTILDRATDLAGKPCLRSTHFHVHKTPERPFARVEVLYHPDTRIPFQISSYDWPEAGHTGDLLLAERYSYENVNTEATLTVLDFDPANPDYAFHRY